MNFLRAQPNAHRFETKKMLLTSQELAYAASARQILTATLDPKQEMQKRAAEKGNGRQGEASRGGDADISLQIWTHETADSALEASWPGKRASSELPP